MSRRQSPLAGFQVIIIGRFWVIAEESSQRIKWKNTVTFKKAYQKFKRKS
jgi:hypothetical protein